MVAPENEQGGVRLVDSPKRVRTYLGGEVIADTLRPQLVWEIPYYPAYYLPVEDVRMELLEPTGRTEDFPGRGQARYFTVTGGETEAVDAAWHFPDSPVVGLRSLVRFDWSAMDHWFEEDEEVFVHPRDPYKRVDVLKSSRHVQAAVNGVVFADSQHPHLLFETSLPTRYYLPLVDFRLDLLVPSDTVSHCPYKGTARYWSLHAGDELIADAVWSYPTPHLESLKVAGLGSFFNERVDLTLDGVLQERPRSPFSR